MQTLKESLLHINTLQSQIRDTQIVAETITKDWYNEKSIHNVVGDVIPDSLLKTLDKVLFVCDSRGSTGREGANIKIKQEGSIYDIVIDSPFFVMFQVYDINAVKTVISNTRIHFTDDVRIRIVGQNGRTYLGHTYSIIEWIKECNQDMKFEHMSIEEVTCHSDHMLKDIIKISPAGHIAFVKCKGVDKINMSDVGNDVKFSAIESYFDIGKMSKLKKSRANSAFAKAGVLFADNADSFLTKKYKKELEDKKKEEEIKRKNEEKNAALIKSTMENPIEINLNDIRKSNKLDCFLRGDAYLFNITLSSSDGWKDPSTSYMYASLLDYPVGSFVDIYDGGQKHEMMISRFSDWFSSGEGIITVFLTYRA